MITLLVETASANGSKNVFTKNGKGRDDVDDAEKRDNDDKKEDERNKEEHGIEEKDGSARAVTRRSTSLLPHKVEGMFIGDVGMKEKHKNDSALIISTSKKKRRNSRQQASEKVVR